MEMTRRQEESLDVKKHIAVTAGAGSGKTWILVERYVAILKENKGITPRNILALTFTDKAASEMKERVKRSVRKMASEEGGRWFDILEELDQADISTIHSFCTRIVRTLPIQAGVDPDFRVISETESSEMIREVLNEIFTTNGPESPALRRLLVDYNMFQTAQMLKGLLRESGKTKLLVGSKEFTELSIHHLEATLKEDLEKLEIEAGSLVHALNDIRSITTPDIPRDRAVQMMQAVRPLLQVLENGSDINFLLNALNMNKMLFLNKSGGERRATNLGNLNVWKGDLGRIRETFALLFRFVHEHKESLPFSSGTELRMRARERVNDLMMVYNRISERFTEEKRKANGLDFSDQIALAISLLRSNEEGILDSLRKRYDHLMVDEFQDTDPDQWELVNLLWDKGERSKLFIVGDPKQSIYGFRSADVRLFLRAQGDLEDHKVGRKVILDRNFRSRKEIMDLVNGIFPTIMQQEEDKWGVPFDPLDAHKDEGGSVTLVGVIKTFDAERREGEEAARIIRSAVNSWMVIDKEEERPLRYSDIAILVPTRKGFNQYEDGLRNANIPFQVYKGKGFFERQEISDVLNLLSFITNPNDDLALASLLKGPFFGMSDEDLMRISRQKGGNLLSKLMDLTEYSEDMDLLQKHIRAAWTLPPHMALKTMMDRSIVYAAVGGRREARNLDRIAEWAVGESSARSILELTERLRRLVEEPPKEGEPPLHVDEESVTMMTIHSAKGLEWPMVLVLGMNHEGGGSFTPPYILDPDNGISLKVADHRNGELVKPPSWTRAKDDASAKEVQERKRLLYVACTRAKDHLVLSGAVPVRRDGVELEPHGMFKLLWDSMDLSINELDEGVKIINGVPVALVPVRPDDIKEVDEEELDQIDIAISEKGSPLPLLKDIDQGTTSYLLSPSKMIEKEDHRGIPRNFPFESSGIPPDEFGDIVHAVLQGIPIERVLREAGREESRNDVLSVVDAINEQLEEMDVESMLHEVEVVSEYEYKGKEKDPFLGRMDLLVKLKDGSYCIIDFKTGARKEVHKEQLEIYKELSKDLLDANVSTHVLYSSDLDP